MSRSFLIFVGPVPVPEGTEALELFHEGIPLKSGARLPLIRKRSPWDPRRDTERIIVGSHRHRADVLLEGRGVQPEHLRFYIPLKGGPADVRPLQGVSVRVGGRPVDELEWVSLKSGEVLEIESWRFYYEAEQQG